MQQTLSSAGSRRDTLLAFIGGRLGSIRNAQVAETRAQAHAGTWVDQVARGKPGMSVPDPSRWSAPAQAYRQAIEALASGDLARGTHLLERAHEIETRAFEALPAQVDLPEAERAVAPLPHEVRGAQGGGEGCPRRSATELIAQADTIVRVSDDADAVSGRRVRHHRGWWDREPDEATAERDEKKASRSTTAPTTAEPERTAEGPGTRRVPAPAPAPELQTPELVPPEQSRLPEVDAAPREKEDAGKDAADRVRTLARKKK